MGVDTRSSNESRVEELKKRVLERGNIPRHVAIIMDGNGRWAKRQGLPRIEGHQAGRKPVREVVEASVELGIDVVTLYTFSSENWNRPRAEIAALMRFLRQTLKEEREELRRNNVTLSAIGRVDDLPSDVRNEVAATVDFLSGSTGLRLILALSYGGRAEIADAARELAGDVAAGRLRTEEIDEAAVEARLYTRELPHPDLLIRTGGEMRLSNFLLWQLAYAEIYVTDVFWPEFSRVHFYEALLDYQTRERRFGRVD